MERMFLADLPVDDVPDDITLDPPKTVEDYRPIPVEAQEEQQGEEEKPNAFDWKVYVSTGKDYTMGTKAKVMLYVYGDKGQTDAIPLETSGSGEPVFLPGGNDDFKINLGKDIGEIYKIRIGHDDPRKEEGWYLEKVTMRDLNTDQHHLFRFNRWLSRYEDEGDTWREQPVLRPGVASFTLMTYNVEVYTGSIAGAATEADAYIHLFGSNGDAGRRTLVKSNNSTLFRFGQVDVFELEAVNLQNIEKVILGHNCKDKGAGWYVDKVIVREADDQEGAIFLFPCSRWFDTQEDDGEIQRILFPGKEEESDWTMWITTGNDISMGTLAPITLVAYGDKGQTESIPLGPGDKSDKNFKPASTDEFKVNLKKDIGRLYKIRIGHDDNNPEEGWYLERVKIKANKSDDNFILDLGRWLACDEDDYDTWRELPAVYPDEQPLPVVTYTLEIYTGDTVDADTQANCYIHVIGSRGDAGRRALRVSNNREKFRRGQVDVFKMDAVSLDEVTKVILGHDGKDKGAGWYVSKVIIQESVTSEHEVSRKFYFPCDRWFDTGFDDSKIERELIPGEPEIEEEQEEKEEEEKEEEKEEGYRVMVVTADDSRAPRRPQVTLKVYGTEGGTEDLSLNDENLEEDEKDDKKDAKKELFSPGSVHNFNVEIKDIGELYKIRIGRQEEDDWDGWHLDEVTLIDKSTKEEYKFKFDRWMARDEDDMDLVRELPLTKKGKEQLPVLQYEVAVYTGDHWAADTDACVHLQLFGSRGDAGRRMLYSSQNTTKFQRNQVDIFTVEAVDLDDLERVVIGHDGVGHGAGWFLDKIVISQKDEGEKQTTSNQKDVDSEQKGEKSKKKDTAAIKDAESQNQDGDSDKKESAGNGVVFYCGRWLDTMEGDGETEVELRPMETRHKSEFKPANEKECQEDEDTNSEGMWVVKVKTSDLEKAGTRAQVYVTVYGRAATSPCLPLGKPGTDDFDRGKESTHTINLDNLGDIYKIRVEHDNSGSSPSWHLQMLTLESKTSGEVLRFYANRWLADDEDDKQTSRELPAVHPDDVMTPVVLNYKVAITTGDLDDTETPSDVRMTLKGTEGEIIEYPLTASSSGSKLWCRGQTDEFVLEGVYLGTLKELILQHDGTNKDSSWFVDKVVIKETAHAPSEWVFPCQASVSPTKEGPAFKTISCLGQMKVKPESAEEDDTKKNEQEKDDRPNSETKGAWTFSISSAELPPGASLSVKAYGILGESDVLHLIGENDEQQKEDEKDSQGADKNKDTEEKNKAANSKDDKQSKAKDTKDKKEGKKEEGQKEKGPGKNSTKKDEKEKKEDKNNKDDEDKDEDEKEKARKDLQPVEDVKVNLGDIGAIYKIRLSYTGEEEWFLYRLKMKDDDTLQEFHFLHDTWLSASSQTRPTTKDIAAIMPDVTPLQECVYEVSILTGDMPRAETEAEIFCTLVGQWGDTGICLLNQPIPNDQPFQNGQCDAFKLPLLSVGMVEKVLLGHNTRGRGEGWYCNHLALRIDENPEQIVFPCNRWFDTGCEDRVTVRELVPDLKVLTPAEDESGDKPITNGLWTCLLTLETPSKLESDSKDEEDVKNTEDKTSKEDKKKTNKMQAEKEKQTHQEKQAAKDKQLEKEKEEKPDSKEDDQKVEKPYGSDYAFGQIVMMVYGDRSAAGPLLVASDMDELKPGVPFEKKLEVGDIGTIQKIRVIDGTLHQGKTLEWQVAFVKLTDNDTKEELVFDFHSVMGEKTENAARDVQAIRPGQCIDPYVTYRVAVHSFDQEPDKDKETKTNEEDTDGEKDADKNSDQNTNQSNNKNQNKADKNASDSKQNIPDDKNSEGSTKPEVEQKEEPKVWICLCGTKGDSGWHNVSVSKAKDSDLGPQGQPKDTNDTKDKNQKQDQNSSKTDAPDGEADKAQNDAATKIQSNYRGYRDRQTVKAMKERNNMSEEERQKQDNAATKIQATFRGYQARKQVKAMREGLDPEVLSFTTVDLGTITKVMLVNISGKDVAIKEVLISSGEFSVREQIFNCFRVLKTKTSKPAETDNDEEEVTSPCSGNWQIDLTDYRLGDVISPAAIPVNEMPDLPVSEGSWQVSTWSGSSEGKSPGVAVVVCGREAETDALLLSNPITENKTAFQTGQLDTFKVQIPEDIGDIFKVRIGFTELPSIDTSWSLKKIHFVNEATGDNFTCSPGRVLTKGDPADGWLELPVLWPSVPQEPLLCYEMAVHTGDVDNADTDANVYVIIKGHGGTSGRRLLQKSQTYKNKFEKGQVDVFTLEAVDLWDLQVVTVGHDGKGNGSGWFLEKIVITEGTQADSPGDKEGDDSSKGVDRDVPQEAPASDEEETSTQKPRRVFVFPCSRWLDEGQDDGLIERDLFALPVEEPEKEFTWQLSVKTAETAGSEEPPPPSEAPRVAVLYGDKGKTQELLLKSAEDNLYQPGFTNEFQLKSRGDVGRLYKMRLGYQTTEGNHTWHLELVRLHCNETSDDYVFEAGGESVIMDSKRDGWTELPLHSGRSDDQLHVCKYQVETHTGYAPGSGTDANVYLEIYGERGDTGRRRLLHSQTDGNKFEAGKVDLFEVSAVDLSKLTKVIVGHDGKGFGSGWFLDKIIIKPSETSVKKFIFNCERWLDEGEDDGLLERELELTELDDGPKAPSMSTRPQVATLYGEDGVNDVTEQTILSDGDYKVLVTTHDESNSGTDAKVTLTVFGEQGDTGPQPLQKDGAKEGLDIFKSAATDEFQIHVDPGKVGKIKKIRLEHDNSGAASGWRVVKLTLAEENKPDVEPLEFPVHRWLCDDEDDGDIVREIPARWPGEAPLPVTTYQVETVTGGKFGSGTDANVYVILHGAKGDSGKRHLRRSKEGGNKFESGKTDEFSLEAVDLGPIERVTIGHDGKGSGSGWYLQEVTVKESTGNKLVFPCDAWLDEDEGTTEKVLELKKDDAS